MKRAEASSTRKTACVTIGPPRAKLMAKEMQAIIPGAELGKAKEGSRKWV